MHERSTSDVKPGLILPHGCDYHICIYRRVRTSCIFVSFFFLFSSLSFFPVKTNPHCVCRFTDSTWKPRAIFFHRLRKHGAPLTEPHFLTTFEYTLALFPPFSIFLHPFSPPCSRLRPTARNFRPGPISLWRVKTFEM